MVDFFEYLWLGVHLGFPLIRQRQPRPMGAAQPRSRFPTVPIPSHQATVHLNPETSHKHGRQQLAGSVSSVETETEVNANHTDIQQLPTSAQPVCSSRTHRPQSNHHQCVDFVRAPGSRQKSLEHTHLTFSATTTSKPSQKSLRQQEIHCEHTQAKQRSFEATSQVCKAAQQRRRRPGQPGKLISSDIARADQFCTSC